MAGLRETLMAPKSPAQIHLPTQTTKSTAPPNLSEPRETSLAPPPPSRSRTPSSSHHLPLTSAIHPLHPQPMETPKKRAAVPTFSSPTDHMQSPCSKALSRGRPAPRYAHSVARRPHKMMPSREPLPAQRRPALSNSAGSWCSIVREARRLCVRRPPPRTKQPTSSRRQRQRPNPTASRPRQSHLSSAPPPTPHGALSSLCPCLFINLNALLDRTLIRSFATPRHASPRRLVRHSTLHHLCGY